MRWLGWLCIGACGGGGGKATPDAAVDAAVVDSAFGAPSDVYPAFHPPVPQIQRAGGDVLATPRVVQIFFADDPAIASMEDFTTKLAASPAWTTMVGEYGVGALTVATPIVLTSNAPASMTDGDLKAMLTSYLDGTHAEWGPVDAATLKSSIYLLHVPQGVAYTAGTEMACSNFGGYHNWTIVDLHPTQYAVVHTCNPRPFESTTLQFDTANETHELVEAVTDPIPPDGYSVVNDVGANWAMPSGPEVGDMCMLTHENWYTPADLGYEIQRSWSNAAMAGYHQYCLPALPGETVFFNAIPATGDPFTATPRGGMPTTFVGTLTHVGVPTTITLDLLSDGPTNGPFTIEALDDASQLAHLPVLLDLALDRSSGQNGEMVHLTITPQSRPATGLGTFTIRSTLGTQKTYWKAIAKIDP